MKRIIPALLLLTAIASNISAQRTCSAMDHLKMIQQLDPSIITIREQIEQFTQNYIDNGSALSGNRAVVTIPVVVHVVYNTTAENISDAQIQSQMTILNNDFRKLNADWTSTPSVFQSLVADCEFQFCLAQRDPSGNATTGIVRVATSKTSFTTNDAVKYTSQGGSNAWPSSSYLNVWVCDLNGYLGYAQFPGGPSATDGVVCDYAAFGNTGAAAYPFNLGRTATHEVGHWLNLYHIWGDDGTGCTGSDQCSDTPNQADENYGCPAFPAVSCSNGPNGDLWMNYMDYTDDRCMYMFTNGQKARMQALFVSGGSRYSLLSSLGCQPPSGGGTCGTPTGLTASSITQTSATISWGAVSGAVSYNVQYKVSSSSTWNTTSTTSTSLGFSGLTAATTYNYQVQAVCSGSTGSYSTAASFTTSSSGGGGCSDTYESNNSLSTAKTIPVNTSIQALIGASGDNDYFKFTNTSAQKNILVTLTNVPFDYDLKLYKSSGGLLATSQNGGTTSEGIKYNNAPVGTYYARVYGYNGAYSATQCYTLTASISNVAFREEQQQDNNLKANTDIQYNIFPNPSTGLVNIEMNLSDMMSAVNIRVFDLLGNVLKTTDLIDVEGEVVTSIDMNNMPNGIYVVAVSSVSGTETRKLIINK